MLPGASFLKIMQMLCLEVDQKDMEPRVPVMQMMMNSAIMAIGITVGKIIISLLSAFAFVYFRFPFRNLCFWLIFITLMLPVEVRIVSNL